MEEENNIIKQPDKLLEKSSSEASRLLSAGNGQVNLELDSKIFAALSYLSILFVVPWVVKKDDVFVKFHVRQGLVLFFAELIAWFILYLIESLLITLFSFGALSFVAFLYKLVWLFFAGVSIVGIYFAVKGKKRKIPILWDLSKNFKI